MANVLRPRDPAKWDLLSAKVRGRYEKNGITRDYYASGQNLSAARGHGKTPERPSRAIKNPERYPEYVEKRKPKVTTHSLDALRQQVKKHALRLFLAGIESDIIQKYDRAASEARIDRATHEELEMMLTSDLSFWRARAADKEPPYNPFYYH